MRNILLLTAVALYSVACASTTPAPNRPQIPPLNPPHLADAQQFQQDLQDAYTKILTRTDKPAPDVEVVDIEAAASIPIPQHRTIDSALRLFTVDMKESIQTSLLRSARYRALIDKALAEQKLPKGLAYLPVIESAYLTKLTSSAGAHGIWQFMPETAREYGLRVDWWVDDRADPERSTRAAAAYLKDLHRMFGDWSLALAAYNCGPNRVKQSLDNNGATTFWELLEASALPKETRGYVPTFFATLLIASDPETYGFTLGKSLGPDNVRDNDKRVEVRGPVSLDYIAEVTGVDQDVLRELNPALRRGVVPPGRGTVRVPAKVAETLAARADTLRDDDAYVKVCTFRLRKGDSVKRLARAIGSKPETILAMNNLDSPNQLGSGDTIYLPVRARELGALLAHSDDRQFYYAVKKGDTLYSIAKRHGLSVAELRELNDMSKATAIHVGQKLRVASSRTMTAGGM
jgi:membrane-bound lytic murein transglycosylase D